jgi:formamidopyrimidine-DNA glycosylase
MQALAERLDETLTGHEFAGYEALGFTGLKTVVPSPESIVGQRVSGVTSRAKYVVISFGSAARIVFHLSQAGRLDIETPPKRTRPKGSVVRFRFDHDVAVLIREHGTERKAGWWVLAADADGPMARLGPQPGTPEFAEVVLSRDDARRVHTILRDQQTVSGIGRGYSDDILHRAGLSPYATLKSLDPAARRDLLDAIDAVLADALERERRRRGGLSEPKLGEHFTVHGKAGLPCPVCRTDLERVSYESHEVVYCPACQTGGKVLADRRRSRLLK